MSKKVVGTAVAAVFATAIASAQSTSQDQSAQQAAGPQQLVTIEGCLQQQPGTSAATVADATFVLQNAQVRSGGEGAVGTAGETARADESQPGTQAEAGRDRADDQTVGTSGAAGAATYGMASYKITGLEDDKLSEHVGQRVQLQGYIETRGEGHGIDRERHDMHRSEDKDRSDADRPQAETPSSSDAATPPAGTTGTGVAGHGAAGTTAPGAEGAADHSRMASAGDMKEFRATSIQRISGECPPASR